jgi:hypothetical protein
MLSQTGNVKMQDAAAATGNGTTLQLAGRSSAVLQVSGTFAATVTWEGTVDGSNWVGVALADLNSTTRARALTATAAGLYLLDGVAGLLAVRARISAYTSGNVTVVGNASE